MLDCYPIVSPGDLKDVAWRLADSPPTIQAQFQAQQATKRPRVDRELLKLYTMAVRQLLRVNVADVNRE